MAEQQTFTTAAQRVLLLPELLENILYYLPTRNIYGVRRACATWEGVIERSITLKAKMFLVQQTDDLWEELINPAAWASATGRTVDDIKYAFRAIDITE
jgi:hypothetical protein